MGQTSNYGLKQWESWEQVKRGEVNGVIAALDEALQQAAAYREVVCGLYAGDGITGRTIPLGFPASFAMVFCQSAPASESYDYYIEHGFLTPAGMLYRSSHNGSMSLHPDTKAVGSAIVLGSDDYINQAGRTYYYIAFREE